jgi:hypothetical protein
MTHNQKQERFFVRRTFQNSIEKSHRTRRVGQRDQSARMHRCYEQAGRDPDRFDRVIRGRTCAIGQDSEWLRKNPPAGQVFNTYEWGDYLIWAGPPNFSVFVTSQAHLVPPDVWRDYLAVIRVASGWEAILDKYGVETIVVDTLRRGRLIGALRKEEGWSVAFENDVAVVFERSKRRFP